MRNGHFLIDNSASADLSFGEERYSRSFPMDVIDLIIVIIEQVWNVLD